MTCPDCRGRGALMNLQDGPACPKCKGVGEIPDTANQLTADLLVQIPKRFPQIRLWRQNTGLAFGADSVNAAVKALARGDVKTALEYLRRRPIRFGVPGQGDISGIIGPSGRRLEIEVKAGRDKMSPEQQAFRAMIIERGGVYIEARDVQTCLGELEIECRA